MREHRGLPRNKFQCQEVKPAALACIWFLLVISDGPTTEATNTVPAAPVVLHHRQRGMALPLAWKRCEASMIQRRSWPVGEEMIALPFGGQPILQCCSLPVADARCQLFSGEQIYKIKTYCNKLGAENSAIYSIICARKYFVKLTNVTYVFANRWFGVEAPTTRDKRSGCVERVTKTHIYFRWIVAP